MVYKKEHDDAACQTRDGPVSLKVSQTPGFPHAIENGEVRSPEGRRCGKSRFGCEFVLLWSTS